MNKLFLAAIAAAMLGGCATMPESGKTASGMNGYAWAFKVYDPAHVPASATMSGYKCGMVEPSSTCSNLYGYSLVDGLIYRSMNKVLWVGVLAPKGTVHEGDIIAFKDAKVIGPILLGAKLDHVARTADKLDDSCHFGKFGRIVIGRTVCEGWTPDRLGQPD